MRRRWQTGAVVVALALSGCRSCQDEAGSGAGPPMPTGMLVPSDAGPGEPAEALDARLRTSRAARPGWLELAPEGNAKAEPLFISVTALALAQNAFARAQPGFGPFGARVVQPDAMGKLAKELRDQRAEWLGVATLADARAKWPGADTLREIPDDAAWQRARRDFTATLEEMAVHVDRLAAQGGGMRVGPR